MYPDSIYHAYEETEGGFSRRCLELTGAISQGKTLEELKVNITDAIQLMLDRALLHKLLSYLSGLVDQAMFS